MCIQMCTNTQTCPCYPTPPPSQHQLMLRQQPQMRVQCVSHMGAHMSTYMSQHTDLHMPTHTFIGMSICMSTPMATRTYLRMSFHLDTELCRFSAVCTCTRIAGTQ